ncbi:MAG: YqaA family protein [Rhodanobacteraceae bacterium]
MRLFRPLYEKAIEWAAKPWAEAILALFSFIDAFIFPVTPEIMLVPMTLARLRRWWRFALLSLVCALVGVLAGYALGHDAFDAARPWMAHLGWLPELESLAHTLDIDAHSYPWRAFGLLVAAGIAPIPMNVAAWAGGIVAMPLLPFMGGIAVGRGAREFLVAGAIRLGGERAERVLHRHIEGVGIVIVVALIALALWRWLR